MTDEGPKGFLGNKWVAVEIVRKGWNGQIYLLDPKALDPKTGKSVALIDPITIASVYEQTHLPQDIKKLNLSIPLLQSEFKLTRMGDCFRGTSVTGNYQAKACLKQKEVISLDITENNKPVFRLAAAPFFKPSLPQTEGRPLTLQQAIDIALATNPSSHSELERKFQSKTMSYQSAARLAPSFRFSTLVSLGLNPINPINYVLAASYLAPFLSLGNWMSYSRSNITSQVADLSYIIVQANLASQIESLVYSYRRDVLLIKEFKDFQTRIEKLKIQIDLIQKREKQDGKTYIPSGLIDSLDTITYSIQSFEISSPLAEDKIALARALGIHDLEIIRNIQIVHENLPIQDAFDEHGNVKILNKNQISSKALTVSLEFMERLQAKYAVEEAQLRKTENDFAFIDLAGLTNGSTGFDLIWQGKLDQSKINEVRANEMTVHDQIMEGAKRMAEAYNSSLEAYKNARYLMKTNRKRLDNLLAPLENFNPDPHLPIELLPSPFNLGAAFHEFINSFIAKKTYHAAFRIARATKDRMLLEGYYSVLRNNPQSSSEDSSDPTHSKTSEPWVSDVKDDSVTDNVQLEDEGDTYSLYHLATEK